MMISSVKAKKMLNKGCMLYLAHIVNRSNKVIQGVKDTQVVQDFLDVFPNNLSRLSPKRKLEFNIELVSSTTPISIVTYRIALVEL